MVVVVERTVAGLAWLSVDELRAGFRAKVFSPSEVLAEALERCEAYASMNPFITLDHGGASAAASRADTAFAHGTYQEHGTLLGIPITIKDLLLTRGLRTTRGSLAQPDWIPQQDSPAVARLRAAGVVILGKTNTSEGGWKADSGNLLVGPSANPWDPRLSAGGSSGGAAVCAALGLAPLNVGTDGAGSIRIPAAFCGVVGVKPTFGRVPYWPPSPEGLSHVGALARSVADAAAAVGTMAGPDPRDPASLATPQRRGEPIRRRGRVRLVTSLGFRAALPRIASVARRAADVLSDAGYDVEEADLDLPDQAKTLDHLWAGHESTAHGDGLDRVAHLLDPGYLALVRRGRGLTAYQLASAHEARAHLRARLLAEFEGYDAVLTPTVAVSPFPLGDAEREGPTPATGLGWAPFTYLFNLTGQPAISIPAELDDAGLPVGVQLVGRAHEDGDLFKLAADYERLRPWKPDYSRLPAVLSDERDPAQTERP